jgi:hypothetical protein
MTQQVQKIAFGERAEEPAKISKGVKISNAASKYTKAAEEKQNFENMADDLMAEKRARNKKVVELASQFMAILKDKTLTENKTILAKDVEGDICNKLIKVSLELNSDESEPEGMGSAALINILLKTTISQRDNINALEYRLSKLEKQLSSQNKEVKSSGSSS